jgi:hypothetical protein
VGIGTSSPSGKLNVSDATSSQININSSANGATRQVLFSASSNTQEAQISANNSTGELKFESGRSGTSAYFQTFYTNNSERMRIDSSGNLLVGTSSVYNSAKVSINQATAGSVAMFIYKTVAGDVGTAGLQIGKTDNNTTTSQVFIQFLVNSANNANGQINANGASQAAFGTYSDSRLKENITNLPSQLASIMALRPVEFDYIESEGGGHQIGFVAQEVKEIYPDLVGERADGMFTLSDLNKNDARLIKAIQELKAINDTQAETINALTARIVALETA